MSLQIRKTTYRNQEGYLICGRNQYSGVFGTRVFALTRGIAEHLRNKLNKNQELRVSDWRVGEVA